MRVTDSPAQIVDCVGDTIAVKSTEMMTCTASVAVQPEAVVTVTW